MKQQVRAVDSATLESLVSAAVAAPSLHNTQPWRFHPREASRVVEVHADRRRALPLTDPIGRALHVSVGAAVFNLRVAAAHLGWQTDLRLLPRADEPGLLAEADLAEPSPPPSEGPDLYGSIWRRHSSRRPFIDEPVPLAVLDRLAEAARAEGACLTLPLVTESARLAALTAEAEERRTVDRGRLAETRSWLRESTEGPFGIPYSALGPGDSRARVPMRDFTGLEPGRYRPVEPFESRPRLLLLSTQHDCPADWLRAGQALEHVLLLLTLHGLRASMLYQAMEWPDLRPLLRDPLSAEQGEPQMLLRVGYGPQGPATPRRPAEDAIF